MSYDERKTAQAAAFLLRHSGGTMKYIKLLKLLYLAERLSYQRYGVPLTGDILVSMKNGPVLSSTYDHIKGEMRGREDGWDRYVADKADYMVGLTKEAHGLAESGLGELSESDIEVLDEVWKKFGNMKPFDLVEYTHTLPEWQKPPEGSALPIGLNRLFLALGFSGDAAARLEAHLREQDAIDQQFA